jgi:hypothetical protein
MILPKEQIERLEKILDDLIAGLEEGWKQKLIGIGRGSETTSDSNGPPLSFLNDEFLNWLTSIRAKQVYSDTLNPNHDENWLIGEQLAVIQVFDAWRMACKNRNKCKDLPECFYEYSKKIDIQKLKEHKAYLRWKSRDGNREYNEADAKRHYYDGCADIFNLSSVCKEAENKHKLGECSYAKILTLIDRRKNRTDRRQTEKEVDVDLRTGSERRKNDIYGCLTQYS